MDIPGVTLVPTVPRAAWHQPDDRWQCQGMSGNFFAHPDAPVWTVHGMGRCPFTQRMITTSGWKAVSPERFTIGPMGTPPPDASATLRRIVDVELDERVRLEAMVRKDLGVDE